jgi:DNA-binding LacI/PurR family transcriptional regulator
LSTGGFDNLEFALHLSFPLTTIEVPAEKMGKERRIFWSTGWRATAN